ncbi:alpha/beta hydrolase [Bradyrhizobium sp. UFLA03-84]|nr:alpha/beta hydrolase [Bradyrhizobium sp. UFLA03-84]
MGGIELIDGAGHWIQQEQPVRLSKLLLAFTGEVRGSGSRVISE